MAEAAATRPRVARDDRAWDEIVSFCQRREADDEALGELARKVAHLVPFDGSLLVGTDPATVLAAPPLRLEGVEGETCQSYWERECLAEDVLPYHELARQPLPAQSLHVATGGRPSRSVRFRELCVPNGFADEVRVAFRVGDSCWGVASLWRATGREPFAAGEIELLAALSAIIGEWFRHAAIAAQAPVTTAPPGPGLLTFDGDGRLDSVNDVALSWIEEFAPPPDGSSELGVAVPSEVYSVAARARAIAAGRQPGAAHARVRGRSGRWLALHASCLRDLEGGLGQTAVIIEPAKASEIAPIIVEAYQLSPREQDITRLIAQGLTTAGIAARLHLSAHTVRDYVKAVFEKVGVSSRGQLVAKLFAEHYYPVLHPDER